jgi:hypothetical protein
MLGHLIYIQKVLKLGLEIFDGGVAQSLMLMCVDLFHCLNYVSRQHHQSFMELGHLFTRSGLTNPEVSLTVYYDFFCQLGNIVS